MRRRRAALPSTAAAAHFRPPGDDARVDAFRALPVPVRLAVDARTRQAMRLIAGRLAGLLPDAQLHRMSATGHRGPVTHANLVVRTIAAFPTGRAERCGAATPEHSAPRQYGGGKARAGGASRSAAAR